MSEEARFRSYPEYEAWCLERQICPGSGEMECECLAGPCDCFVQHPANCGGCSLVAEVWRNSRVIP